MTQVTRPFDAVLSQIRKETASEVPNPEVVEALALIGRAAIERAAESKRTKNDTGNQLEAFAFGVYFAGRSVRQGYLDKARYRSEHKKDGQDVKGAPADPKRHRMGRSMALHELRDHRPDHMRYELYLTNAMWYSAIHEHWGLRIITQEIIQASQDIAMKFGVDIHVSISANGTAL